MKASEIKGWMMGERSRKVRRVVAGIGAGVVIFAAGIGVGDGRIYAGMFRHNETGLPAHLDYASVNEVYQLIRDNYDGKLTTSQVLDGIKSGLANAAGDPYTEYFNPSQATAFNEELDGTFSGIGAELSQDSNNNLEVIAPIDGSPAAKAGLQAHDHITAIDGKSTAGESIDDAVSAIRGPAGSKVVLDILRGSQPLKLSIMRANITVPSVTSKMLNGNIGYLQISQFSTDTASLATAAAQQFKQKGAKGVILDLRDDPGGMLDAAVDVSSLWLPEGKMVLQQKRGNTVTQTYESTGDDTLHGFPTVILVNGGTASAAEITAGALHDNGVATIVGEKTFGKGVVQQVIPLSGGAELKVTVASWYRPNGQNINHKGISPDKVVGLTAADAKAGNDPQQTAALQILGVQ